MRNLALGIGAVLGLAFVGYLVVRRTGQAIANNVELVTPTSDKNLVYQGANAVGQSITGDSSFTVGGWLYDLTHPDINAQVQALKAGAPPVSDQTIGYVEPATYVYQDPLSLSP
ncbi:MAG TPA: hypothetical protein VFV90_07670 [Usitatibacter sp.]|nr:hypothetical protein [Usitatibacter sp.]